MGEHILATDEWVSALAQHPFESSKYLFSISNLHFHAEKKGKFLSFLKVKAKPMQPRKPKASYELITTLKSFKK